MLRNTTPILDSKISESRFGREELENSINWMKLLGPRLISYIFETDDERVEFDLITIVNGKIFMKRSSTIREQIRHLTKDLEKQQSTIC